MALENFNPSDDAAKREQGFRSNENTTILQGASLREAAEEEVTKKLEEENIASYKRQNEARVKLSAEIIEKLIQQGTYVSEETLQTNLANIDEELTARLEALEKEAEEAAKIQDEEARKKKLDDIARAKEDAKLGAKQRQDEAKQAREESKKAVEQQLNDKQKQIDKAGKKAERQKKAKERSEKLEGAKDDLFGKGKSITTRVKALKDITTTGDTGIKGALGGVAQLAGVLTNAIGDFAKKLDNQIESIARKQSTINTRLQGSDKKWQDINKTFNKVAGASPLIKQEDLVTNLENMVEAGINYNVEQRAFLATISKKIATTFNAADSTLLKLVRLQQKDSTAARLGMESTMTAFLNNMYENTEYLKGVAESVRSQLAEAESLMSDTGALEFEYQMQKWLGSLYSVGMSQSAVNNIAGAVGKLAAGDISGITGGGTSNLLMMAANQSGISITDALADGLDASKTNKLMQAMVEYLAGLYNNSKNSKVLQQQFAQVYGVQASDLKAAVNLANDNSKTINAISNNNLTYSTAIQQLTDMAGTMYQRTSMGEMLENGLANLKYTMSSGIANNPALYTTYKIAGILDDVVGGIQLPFINTFFGGIDLHTSVADIMRTAALSGSILSGLGGIIGSLSGGRSGWGTNMLKTMGIGSNVTSVKRGSGTGLATSGVTVSESGYAGNASGSDVQNKTMSSADEQKQEAQATEEDNGNETMERIDQNVAAIKGHTEAVKTLLEAVANGQRELHVNARSDVFAWSPIKISELGH